MVLHITDLPVGNYMTAYPISVLPDVSLDEATSYGATGTPGFFIGNEKIGFIQVSGAQPYSVFQRVFDQ